MFPLPGSGSSISSAHGPRSADLRSRSARGAAPAATTASGLKDALRIATDAAVANTSQPGGFLDNPKIRIPLPGKLESMANGLRAMGMSAKVDELEVAMNTAAEKAAGEATPVFSKALGDMTFKDASGILSGGDTAATQYFKRTTSADLTTRFRPIVDQAMAKVGVVQQYDALVSSYASTPFGSAPKLDLGGYRPRADAREACSR